VEAIFGFVHIYRGNMVNWQWLWTPNLRLHRKKHGPTQTPSIFNGINHSSKKKKKKKPRRAEPHEKLQITYNKN